MPHGLFYQRHEPESATDKALPALVLIHGLFGNADNLSVIRRAFEQNRVVISIDLPNHGRSLHTDNFDFDDSASRVVALLEELNLGSCVLVGHSLGGKISMLVAKQRPDLIAKLVIMDIAPIAYTPRHQNVFDGLRNVDLTSIRSRTDAKTQLAVHVKDAGTQAFLLKGLYQDEQQNWQWRFNLDLLIKDYEILSAWPYSGLCYSGPTLFLIGAESDYVGAEHQNTIMLQFPKAKAKIIQAGHWLHAQKPQVVNALLTKFLRGE